MRLGLTHLPPYNQLLVSLASAGKQCGTADSKSLLWLTVKPKRLGSDRAKAEAPLQALPHTAIFVCLCRKLESTQSQLEVKESALRQGQDYWEFSD